MAYKDAYMALGSYVGGKHPLKVWHYVTEDTPATVDTAGYFNAKVAELAVGDLVWVYQATDEDNLAAGIADVSLHVVLSNDGTAVDISDDLLGATVADTD
ncbi:MAG TPA: hypothetical protein VGB90_05770 [Alphaproteobacteria bacterium]|jgi:hypothetical protein